MISSLGTVFALFNNTILGEFSVPFKGEREGRVQSAEQDRDKKLIWGKERKGKKKKKKSLNLRKRSYLKLCSISRISRS
jgi:hypothetical protein